MTKYSTFYNKVTFVYVTMFNLLKNLNFKNYLSKIILPEFKSLTIS